MKYNEDRMAKLYECIERKIVNFMYNSIMVSVDIEEAEKHLDALVINSLFRDRKQLKKKYNKGKCDRIRSHYNYNSESLWMKKMTNSKSDHAFCQNECRMHQFGINTNKSMEIIKLWVYKTACSSYNRQLERKLINLLIDNAGFDDAELNVKPFVADENGLIVKLTMDGGTMEFDLRCEYWREMQSGDKLHVSEDLYVYLKLLKPKVNATPINIFLHTQPLCIWNIYLCQQKMKQHLLKISIKDLMEQKCLTR